MSLTIGVDVGGTKTAAGLVDQHGSIVEQLRYPTPAGDSGGITDMIVAAVADLLRSHPAQAVGIGAAGFVSETADEVLFAPHLAWRGEPVARQVAERTGLPVVVENDANAAAWAEATLGAGRGQAHMVLVGIGTGIGTGLVLNGELYRGRWGIAGEAGHYRVVPDGRLCGCGNRGCWEQYASGSALVAEARDFARRSPDAASRLLRLGDGSPEGITGREITLAAQQGDAVALRCFEIVGGWLGNGLADLAAILDPGCFVIGGGVSEAGDLLLAPARTAFHAGLTGGRYRPRAIITVAELGAAAGLIGAASLARRRLSPDGRKPSQTRSRNRPASQTTAP